MINNVMDSVAIIGGEGKLPLLAYEGVCKKGEAPFLIEIAGITSPDLIRLFPKDRRADCGLFQIGKLRRICCKHQIKKILFVGRIPHQNIYRLRPWKMDFGMLKVLFSCRDLRADTLLASFVDYLGEKGVEVQSTLVYLSDYVAKEGFLNGLKPNKTILDDIVFAYHIAKELGRVDVGQTVLVKKRSVVALEAMEGSDRCVERAGDIAGAGCVMVKVAKPSQDPRFDVPVIGKTTIKKLIAIKAAALAIEAEQTFIIDPDALEDAKEAGIPVIALKDPEKGFAHALEELV